MTIVLKWFYTAMLWLSCFESAVSEATSRNFNYVMNCRERVRYWQCEQRKFELSRGLK